MILITGGAGYIGSHTCVSLLETGHEVLILDNLSNSQPDVIDRIAKLCKSRPEFILGDVRDHSLLDFVFASFRISAVIHFAGLKSVAESVEEPLTYYDNNVSGSLELLSAMRRANVRTMVFSSSATVYGSPASLPLTEDAAKHPQSPYGKTKLAVEEMLEDIYRSEAGWGIARLRYFNPGGAHPSGLIGESPTGIPNNLLPYLSQVAAGLLDRLKVYGNDYETPDGTGMRDFIHVMDLAAGHVAALKLLQTTGGLHTLNLGTGRGVSVLDVISAFERASHKKIPYDIVGRRPGDIAAYWADPTRAQNRLGWCAKLSIDDICRDTWAWQTGNGYK